MRPGMIVLSSAVLAFAAAAAMIRPELAVMPHEAILPRLVSLSPTLALVALAVYALCAILLISCDMIADGLRVRFDLTDERNGYGPAHPDWTAALARSGFRRLVPAAVLWSPAAPDGTVMLQNAFQPHQARREVARLYYIAAARVHFFSALALLAAGVVLGAAQMRVPLPFVPGPIPTVPAALAVAALLLLAVVARIAVDVAAEPLIETISRLPAEPVEVGLLRRTAELLSAAPTASFLPVAAPPAAVVQIPDRLSAVIEQGHAALSEAVERLSATTEWLAQTTKSSIEALETAFRETDRREQMTPQPIALDMAAVTDLRDALTALTAILQRAQPGALPEPDGERTASAAKNREPDLALELHKLLQEVKTS